MSFIPPRRGAAKHKSTIETFARKYRLRFGFEVEGDPLPVVPGPHGVIYEFEPGTLAVMGTGIDLDALRQAGLGHGYRHATFTRMNPTHCLLAIEAAGCPQRAKRILSPTQLQALAAMRERWRAQGRPSGDAQEASAVGVSSSTGSADTPAPPGARTLDGTAP